MYITCLLPCSSFLLHFCRLSFNVFFFNTTSQKGDGAVREKEVGIKTRLVLSEYKLQLSKAVILTFGSDKYAPLA